MSKLYYPGYQTRTWNPFVGCDHGEKFGCLPKCWAAGMVNLHGGEWGTGRGFRPRLIEKWLRKPLSWKRPQVVAMGFLGDIACLTSSYDLANIFNVMRATPQHTYLLLTKDPARLAGRFAGQLSQNIIMGLTVRNQEECDAKIPDLFRIKAERYWLSVEPMLGPVDIGYVVNAGEPWVDWVVVGCESGRGARWGHGIHHDTEGVVGWSRSLVSQCRAAGVPCFVKQLPVFKDGAWRVSSDPADFPEDLRVRETPCLT